MSVTTAKTTRRRGVEAYSPSHHQQYGIILRGVGRERPGRRRGGLRRDSAVLSVTRRVRVVFTAREFVGREPADSIHTHRRRVLHTYERRETDGRGGRFHREAAAFPRRAAKPHDGTVIEGGRKKLPLCTVLYLQGVGLERRQRVEDRPPTTVHTYIRDWSPGV